MSEITEEYINEFNQTLKNMGSIIKLRRNGFKVDIGITDNAFVSSFVLNPSNEFYSKLEAFLKTKGIHQVTYNNTGSCFW
ncbi:hypothetical protein GRF59_15055 [Paenibacillus sp. HJL G12]|uniref:Uncharacterized protein n=1 Tax=Paenibacillus dendrobii TaxID=2691084 RepID=A0A7X3IJ52_9BACL|nr:hypothetical protein [Paenibacillus dendrobii]MWV44939.1 hypothetical protein [Paenibacillus dendrobii]